ncbi:MAG: class II aldolase/adducin family protein [Candidatus Hatepunaea meridiana]|nr:class II aldolase/adducin family protein [Candidatus Hatepunaea meridiana]
MTEEKLRSEMIVIAHRMYNKELVAATGGNISYRLDKNRFLLTPTGRCKGDLTEDDLLVCDEEGKPLEEGVITSEASMHLEAYLRRPDINAIVHAHPPYTVALSMAGIPIEGNLLPEAIIAFGQVPTSNFAIPSTNEGAIVIRKLIDTHNALILDRHGAVTVGKSLRNAYYLMERLEYISKVIYLARCIGVPKPLTKDQIRRIQAVGAVKKET